ncbi:MAG: DUF167 domain-containing protein [Deltaproteobacteria bacterium]|mgnify:CR=1 FL=1
MKRLTRSSSSQNKYPFIEATPKGLYLRVRLQPRSSKNVIDGVQGNCLKLRLTAPPVEGEANKALVEFLSGLLKIKKSSIEIDSGHKSREKRVRIDGLTPEALEGLISALLG